MVYRYIVFYMAYHCTVFLDYYLTIPPDGFKAVLSYMLTYQNIFPEEAIDDVIPDRIYSKQEMLDYVQVCREKCPGHCRPLLRSN